MLGRNKLYNTKFWAILFCVPVKQNLDKYCWVLGIYPKDCKSGCNNDTCTPMFIAALFTIAKLWNSPDALQLMNGLRICDM
jgi:hypothetical protein